MRRNNELSLKRALHAMFKRDCLHYLHKPSQIINPLLFFFMITASIPFAIDTNEFFKELNDISDLLDVDEENNTNNQEMINIFRSW